MGQSWPLFVYFRPSHIAIVLGTRTRASVVGADGSTELQWAFKMTGLYLSFVRANEVGSVVTEPNKQGSID